MNSLENFNRLKDEKSLYLLQHKNNPVHWYPFGPEAFLKAKEEDKPIFMSIGYSTCHWCHVMNHESFENKEIAEILNQNFICIKVDREEQPDIDQYYQTAINFFGRQGGWPLSSFMLPDSRPFFMGTYFPVKTKDGKGTFAELLMAVMNWWNNERAQITENAAKVTEGIKAGIKPERIEFEGHFPAPMAIMSVLKQHADIEEGGYGETPKFPQFAFYEWAVEQMLEGMIPEEFGSHIIKTAEKMLMGGLVDQAKGGIHRYSVDKTWTVPHFEKMLYDQAGFLKFLAKLSLVYPAPIVFDSMIQTLDYLETEMLSEQKYFFAAQDADSEGVEGLYFTYSQEEFEDVLNSNDDSDETFAKNIDRIKTWFNITSAGNFDKGLNVISLNWNLKDEIFKQENWEIIRKVKHAIVTDRKMRVPPATDNKGVASWNFMLLTSLVDVMQYCQIDVIKQRAYNLFQIGLDGAYKTFLQQSEDGLKILHSTTKEESVQYFEDYVSFAELMMRVYEVTANVTFKQNFEDTIKLIHQEFFKDGNLYTRAVAQTDLLIYPNQVQKAFDQSFKSMVSTYIQMLRRSSLIIDDNLLVNEYNDLIDQITHEVLRHPMGAGEALRALTYPDQVLRTIKVPQEWSGNPEFVGFLSYFLPRFTFDYRQDKTEEWQICNREACELKGFGLQEFINTLRPQTPESNA